MKQKAPFNSKTSTQVQIQFQTAEASQNALYIIFITSLRNNETELKYNLFKQRKLSNKLDLEYSKTVSGCRIYYSANVLVLARRMDQINPSQVLAKLLISFF
ncbi:Hypothetical_protein [Hexamita inflata]|uniref:Hypothetical_protein n=1 Tax=Hexamita inflata TaxID=28002 RepID=A0AA86QNJ7_9EUKA|nr:Hypothetical protein HINF_LOCUS45083 [Hexamita inflata]